jgi:hypothetical protein
VDTVGDRAPACAFCEGTGLWADADGDAVVHDPCPLCDGSGAAPADGLVDVVAAEAPPATSLLAQARALVARMTQAERQQLYEELHGRWDCRIYR